MTEGRRREEWDHTAAILAPVLTYLGGKPVDPAALNPYRRPRLSAEMRRKLDEANDRDGWRLLETGLREHARAMRGS